MNDLDDLLVGRDEDTNGKVGRQVRDSDRIGKSVRSKYPTDCRAGNCQVEVATAR